MECKSKNISVIIQITSLINALIKSKWQSFKQKKRKGGSRSMICYCKWSKFCWHATTATENMYYNQACLSARSKWARIAEMDDRHN